MNAQILKDILSSRKEDNDYSDNEKTVNDAQASCAEKSSSVKKLENFLEPCQCTDATLCTNFNMSNIENAILNSIEPIDLNDTEEINANGETYVWANKSEISNWIGPIPIEEYPINDDPNPVIITKNAKCVQTKRDVIVKYLEPPVAPIPGKIIVNQEANYRPPEAPPIIIRKEPERPETPEPIVIREAPPPPPRVPPVRIITIPGKIIKPPREVIYEKLPEKKCQHRIICYDRWVPCYCPI